MIYALWALAGWCGTPWPWWWKWKWQPPPPPPDPWWWVIKGVAVLGGLLGGWAASKTFDAPLDSPAAVAATTLGALVCGRFLSEAIGYFGGAKQLSDAGQ
ncbi:MAG: bacterial/archaeal transporter family-2 protein [Acidobacteriota bacterium]|jgi:hypothetical protein|nr:bacterial/archaeal transporter family-2 protein [Acidobacteriota bacterium]MDT7807139.1 bacterial/archaeal transporter family-2 protein [Acidobacteriota bacterium]